MEAEIEKELTPAEKANELFHRFCSFNNYGYDLKCSINSAIYLCQQLLKETVSPERAKYLNEVMAELRDKIQ